LRLLLQNVKGLTFLGTHGIRQHLWLQFDSTVILSSFGTLRRPTIVQGSASFSGRYGFPIKLSIDLLSCRKDASVHARQ